MDIPLILGRPFLVIGKNLIDVYEGKLILKVGDEQGNFDVYKVANNPNEQDAYLRVDDALD